VGLYPVVAWQFRDPIQDDLTYALEGSASDTGTIINWAMSLGLFREPSELADLANSVDSSDGVYFIPAFSGLGVSFCGILFPLFRHGLPISVLNIVITVRMSSNQLKPVFAWKYFVISKLKFLIRDFV
jgi:hypothetical protein